MIFQQPPGDVHIKYGYIINYDYYVIKIASGFYENAQYNLPSSNGIMLIFCRKTGSTLAILCDEGHLTDLRTAAAGAIVAKHLAPKNISAIGIIGTGTQAKLQLLYLKKALKCRNAIIWGRHEDKLEQFKNSMEKESFTIKTTQTIEEVTSNCQLIVTTTPASSPLLSSDQILPGTHITAVGADSPNKQELDPYILQKADIIVADSITQCLERGEISHAVKNNIIQKESLYELGNIICSKNNGRTSDAQITIADLTGLAVQDIAIATIIYKASNKCNL